MNTGYHNPTDSSNCATSRSALRSRDKKLEHVNRAEKLLAETRPEPQLSLRVPLLPHHRIPARHGRRGRR